MTNKIVIPPATDSGDSGRGASYWLSFLGCPQRYVFDKATGSASESARVGQLFHKLLELYYQGQLQDVVLEYKQGPADPDWVEAQRLFAAYRMWFPRDEFVIKGCETPLEAGCEVDHETATTAEIEKVRACVERYGVPIFTGRADMLVDVTEAQVPVLEASRKLHLEPGPYLLDTKTKKATSQAWPFEYGGSLQFHAYMMMLEEMGTPVKGCIVNIVVRHKGLTKDKSSFTMLVPPPTDYHRRYVKSTLAKALKMRDTFGADRNPHECFAYMKVCPHLESGLCDRTPNANPVL